MFLTLAGWWPGVAAQQMDGGTTCPLVPGYTFYLRKDWAAGSILADFGSDVDAHHQLAQFCSKAPTCQGFNTLGQLWSDTTGTAGLFPSSDTRACAGVFLRSTLVGEQH